MLNYALLNWPTGATINENTGVITWTPTETQGPSTNLISVRITDNGSPALAVTNTFNLIVSEVNTAPVLTPLANCTHVPGALCSITNAATDGDRPAQALTYSLVAAPPNMTIDPASGLIAWAPPATADPATNTVIVRVTDNGSPALATDQAFAAELIPIPRLRITENDPEFVVLAWPAEASAIPFVLQSTTNLLVPGNWADVFEAPTVTAAENRLTNHVISGFHAYRLASPLAALPALRHESDTTNSVIAEAPRN
jgi:hypothetical protein